MIGIDTNVLVRFFLHDDKQQAAKAQAFLANHCNADTPGWISRIVLCELVWVLERSYQAPREEIAEVLDALAQTAEFRLEDAPLVWSALQLYRDGRADFADALLAVANRAQGCDWTATFDRKAAGLDGMRLIE